MLLIYQIKVGLCLIAFYLLWKLLLSRETARGHGARAGAAVDQTVVV